MFPVESFRVDESVSPLLFYGQTKVCLRVQTMHLFGLWPPTAKIHRFRAGYCYFCQYQYFANYTDTYSTLFIMWSYKAEQYTQNIYLDECLTLIRRNLYMEQVFFALKGILRNILDNTVNVARTEPA